MLTPYTATMTCYSPLTSPTSPPLIQLKTIDKKVNIINNDGLTKQISILCLLKRMNTKKRRFIDE